MPGVECRVPACMQANPKEHSNQTHACKWTIILQEIGWPRSRSRNSHLISPNECSWVQEHLRSCARFHHRMAASTPGRSVRRATQARYHARTCTNAHEHTHTCGTPAQLTAKLWEANIVAYQQSKCHAAHFECAQLMPSAEVALFRAVPCRTRAPGRSAKGNLLRVVIWRCSIPYDVCVAQMQQGQKSGYRVRANHVVAKVQLVVAALQLSVRPHHDLANAIGAAAGLSRPRLLVGHPANHSVADVRADLSRPGNQR
jgi:hypothetical protein